LAVVAAHEAWRDSGLSESNVPSERMGVYLGAGKGEAVNDIQFIGSIFRRCLDDQGAFSIPQFVNAALESLEQGRELEVDPGRAAYHIARMLGLSGPNSTCLTACAAGAQALGEAYRQVRENVADVVIGGGCHSMITPQGIIGFNLLGALSTDNEDPRRASRPFDATRNGFVLAEGAAMVVLEEYEHAKRRRASILAELAGYGCTADAFRVTDPNPDAAGEAEAIVRALKDAGVNPDDVDYINAHGTSTISNDQTETKAIKRTFGDRAYKIPVSSTKSLTGHLIAAAGALEAIVCAYAINNGVVPGTHNYSEIDEECDLDYIPNDTREVRVDVALSNSFGFGGQNTALVIRRV